MPLGLPTLVRATLGPISRALTLLSSCCMRLECSLGRRSRASAWTFCRQMAFSLLLPCWPRSHLPAWALWCSRQGRSRSGLHEIMTEQTHFGFSRVPLKEKQARVDEVFDKVAFRYDLMNDLMSGGLHRIWKDIFASKIRPPKKARFRHLDVAGGTGDIAFRVADAGSALTDVIALDINSSMLEEGG